MEHRKLAAAFAALLALTPAWGSAQPVPTRDVEPADEGGRIVGGKEAPAGTAPWQAEIYSTYVYTDADVAADKKLKPGDAKKYYLDTKSDSERIHRCGGAYIGDMWVLTAAHCIEGDMLKARRVRLGTQNLESGGATYAIDRVVVHKGYGSDKTHSNDIALLHIKADAKTGMSGLPPTVKAIRILGEQPGDRPITPGDQVKVTGWGRTSAKDAGGGELAANGRVNHGSAVLKELALSVLPPATCAAAPPYANVKFDTVVCAKSSKEGEDSCNGDSGGPLTRAQGKDRVLVGLVSWGRGCALPNMPGIYTRAPAYLDWIAAAKRGAQPGKLVKL